MKQILLVEDEKEIANITYKYLVNEGYEVFLATNGLEALTIFNSHKIDLVLLDIMMPGLDGFSVLKEIRLTSMIPIIIVSARISEADRLKGFDLGVDDYVLKPFSPRELMLRVKALLRRVQTNHQYEYLGLSLDLNTMEAIKDKHKISLTSSEYALLKAFFEHPNQVLTREQLIKLVFNNDYDGYDRSIDTHIKRLRAKIESDPKNPTYIHTKYGAGYVFGKN